MKLPTGLLVLCLAAAQAQTITTVFCRGMHSKDGQTAVRRIQGVLSLAKKDGAATASGAPSTNWSHESLPGGEDRVFYYDLAGVLSPL